MIISKKYAPHYHWGEGCDAWILLRSDQAIVKEEQMPPGTEEVPHFHQRTDQLFYILEGEASFLVKQEWYHMEAGDSITIKKGSWHKIANRSPKKLRFLICSFPGNGEDRITV